MRRLTPYLIVISLLIGTISFAWASPMVYAPDKKIVVVASANKIWYRHVEMGNTPNNAIKDTYWHEARGVEGTATFKSVIYAASFYTNGQWGMFQAIANKGTIWYSTDGINWNPGNLSTSTKFEAVTYVKSAIGDKFYAAGFNTYNGGLWSSPDGVTWHNRQVLYRPLDLRALANNGKNLIVSIGGGAWLDRKFQYLYSNDGGTTFDGGNIDTSMDFHDVTFANGIFVAVGSYATIYHSTDGQTWTIADGLSGRASLNKVAYWPGSTPLFIAVGDAATAFHSPDGKTWTRANINGSTNLTTLAIGDFKDANNADHWVAIAGGAEKKESIFRSDNGTDWKVATANNSFPGVVALTQINNGQFYALANPADDMVTYSSSDGQAWLAQGSFIDKDGSLDVGEAGTQRAIAVTPDGLHAYTGSFNNSLLWYNVNRETGALTYQGQIPISHKSLDLVVTPDGKYLYSARGSSIYCYTINSDGSLIDERVTAVPNVSGLTNVTVHPNGKYLYSASNDRNKDYIVWHEIDPNDGSLTLGGSITRTSKGLNSFVIAPSGDRAYGIDYENRIRTYQVASNGALAPFFQENYFVADNQLNTKLTLSPDGKYLVAFNALNAYQFKVNPSSLTSDFSSSPFDKRPMNAAFAPSGGYLYFVQEDSSQIRWFSVVQ